MKTARIVHKLVKEVRSNLTEYEHYLVAVSGGSDSMVLVDICSELASEGFANFTVCHVEHGIRGQEALDDMAFVEAFCKEKNLSFIGKHVDALGFAKNNKLSIEDAARRLRYETFYKAMKEVAASRILTAHQADDQAETVLWRLLRGAGLEGLSGMSLDNGKVLRPMLNITRKEITAYLEKRHLSYRIDSTNTDTNYTRNRIRQELLPYLANNYNERIWETLSRTAKVLAEDAVFLEELAQKEYNQIVEVQEKEQFVLNAKKLVALRPAVCKRVLRYACFKFGINEIDFERTQAVYEMLLRKTGNKVIELPQAVTVTLKKNKLVFSNKF